MGIATLDFRHYWEGGTEQRDQFCKELCAQLSTYGFTKIRNATFSNEIIDQLFYYIKAKAAHPEAPNPHRGWSAVGKESVVKISKFEQDKEYEGTYEEYRKNQANLRSHLRQESYDQGAANDSLFPNRWVPESDLPGFRAFMEDFYNHCYDFHAELLRCISHGLGLAPEILLSKHQSNTSELRLLHYPPIPCSKLSTGMRIGEHSDFGTLTLLLQDAVGGLQIEDQRELGSFIPVEPDSMYEVIVNVGDCLQRWTNRELRSANHRVTLPEGKSVDSNEILNERYAAAYFGKPDRDVLVDTLPEFCDEKEGKMARYTDQLTALEYMQSKLLRTYA